MALALTSATPAAAQELLHNGGFEQGTSGWNGLGISTAGCTPLAGNAALAVPAFLQQNLPSPIGSGATRSRAQ